MHAVSANGVSMKGEQWIDEQLNIVVRQQNDAGAVDELRNIKPEKLKASLFAIPKNYARFEEQTASVAKTDSAGRADVTDNIKQ